MTGPDEMTEATQMQVYVRHWHPSTYTVDKTQEIILSDNSPEHLKLKVLGTYAHTQGGNGMYIEQLLIVGIYTSTPYHVVNGYT